MQPNEIEQLEQTVLSMVVQAITDFREQTIKIFREETDLPQDIAEDVTREALEVMGMSKISERLYGKVTTRKPYMLFCQALRPSLSCLMQKQRNPMEIERQPSKCRRPQWS